MMAGSFGGEGEREDCVRAENGGAPDVAPDHLDGPGSLGDGIVQARGDVATWDGREPIITWGSGADANRGGPTGDTARALLAAMPTLSWVLEPIPVTAFA